MNDNTKEMLRLGGFTKEVDRVEGGICPLCDIVVDKGEFKDEMSRREYEISGMCNKCQNDIVNV